MDLNQKFNKYNPNINLENLTEIAKKAALIGAEILNKNYKKRFVRALQKALKTAR